ncbi:hypothetical protein J4H92_04045 [Leucobacter weissii]|uniref:Roadblock/LAMTOR2 domain-containing protein n=1 Tax=Leucobacter weissii TaxID=1983706 RepID=A0A939S5A2_9MICO|nr:hypothetical protein [Leucobacter weissii]MBO1901119.1 hypothetical protein [Leucobacter weissii]
MSINEVLNDLVNDIDGGLAALLGDSESGMLLASAGSGLDLEVAAAGTTEFMRAKLNTMRALGLEQSIEDILVTLGDQYHIIRPIAAKPEIFIWVAVDRARSNLALARLRVKSAEQNIAL